MPKATEKVKHDRGRSWDQEEEDLLLQIWAKEDIKQKLDGTVRNVVVHEEMQRLLAEAGYERSLTSIQNKIKNLKRRYQQTLQKNKKSGEGRTTCVNYDLLDDILGDRPTSVPVITGQAGVSHVMESREEEEEEDEDGEEEDGEEDEITGSISDMDESEDDTLLFEDVLNKSSAQKIGQGGGRPNASNHTPSTPSTSSSHPSSATCSESGEVLDSLSVDDGESSSKKRRVNDDAQQLTKTKTKKSRTPRRNVKNTRLKETMSLVADSFKGQLSKSQREYRDDLTKLHDDQKEWDEKWLKQRELEHKSHSETMTSMLSVFEKMANAIVALQSQQPQADKNTSQQSAKQQPSHSARQPSCSTPQQWIQHQHQPSNSSPHHYHSAQQPSHSAQQQWNQHQHQSVNQHQPSNSSQHPYHSAHQSSHSAQQPSHSAQQPSHSAQQPSHSAQQQWPIHQQQQPCDQEVKEYTQM